MNEINERQVALEAFMEVIGGGYNNIVLSRTLSRYPELSREKKAFVTECVNGTLRRLYTLDYIINQVSSVNTRSMDAYILNVLRLAIYQLEFMKNAAEHAVCDEAVKLVANSKHGALKGFVNANLRNILRLLPKIIAGIDKIKASDRLAWFEINFSCSRAIAQALEWELGLNETELLLEHFNNRRPPVTVCVNTLKTTREKLTENLRERGITVNPGKHWEGALRLTRSSGLGTLPAYHDGLFHVMDEGAILAVKAAELRPGQKVLDVCAAPGGKSFMAAIDMGDEGHIDARDIHEHKLALIKEGTKRLGIQSITVKNADATTFDESCADAFDAVLADVPCSGLGLLGKKPDIRYRFNISEISKLQGLQRRILNNCAKYVKPGGTLVYSTCTLTAEENRKNAAWFAKTHSFTLDSETLLLPHKSDTDGFYFARFTNKL